MIQLHERYLIDAEGRPVAVVLDMAEYERLATAKIPNRARQALTACPIRGR